MTTIAPGAEVPAIPPVAGETRAAKAHKALTNRWASLAAVVIAVLWTVPTAGLLISSFRPQADVQGNGWWNFFTHPSVTLDNYKAVLHGSDTDLATYFVNSIAITIPSVIIPISIATMAAYAFAWMKFPGRNILFVGVFALQIVPIQVTMIPLLSIYANPPSYPSWVPTGWVDFAAFDHAGHIWPRLAGGDAPGGGFYTIWLSHSIFALPLAIYLLHNFMKEIPAELIEAARVDGAGHVRIFSRIMLPLMVPAIAAFGIFQFLWVWNDLLVALVFGGGSLDVSPLTVRLAELSGTRGQDWHLLAAGAFVSLIVPLIVFLAGQRYFVRGLLSGSVKG
jgi:alpha-glucoside transport system permease protein